MRDALLQILRDSKSDDEELFQRLQAAGLVKGATRSTVQGRCWLYTQYFPDHL